MEPFNGQSFYGQLQSLLQNKASGRFIAQILKVMVEHDPAPIRRFVTAAFPRFGPWRANSVVTATCEEPYRAPGGVRGRRDLTIVVDDIHRVHFEIKFDDDLIEAEQGDQRQLKNELRACEQEGALLIVLTKNPLRRVDHDLLRRGHGVAVHRYFSELADALKQGSALPRTLLLEYLSGQGLILNHVHSAQLYLLLHRLLKPWSGAGKVAIADLRGAPEQLSTLMRNLSLIANDIRPNMHACSTRQRTTTIDMWMEPLFARRDVAMLVKNAQTDAVSPDGDARRGGSISVLAQHALGTSRNHLYITYGVRMSVAPGKDRRIQWVSFARVSGSEINRNWEKNDEWPYVEVTTLSARLFGAKREPDKGKFVHHFAGLIVRAIDKTQQRELVDSLGYRKQLQRTRLALGG